jgi:Electron transfer DM13
MKSRPRWSILTAGAFIVLILFTFPLWRRILVAPTSSGSFALASDAQKEAFAKLSKSNGAPAASTAYFAMLTSVPAPTAEQPTPNLPDAVPVLNADFGNTVAPDAFRQAQGSVTLYRSADGSLLLRFDNFQVTNGPQMVVYLVAVPTPLSKDDLDLPGVTHFEVGPLKGNQGNQQFAIPKDLQFTRYQSVVVYSESLQLIYASAQLYASK